MYRGNIWRLFTVQALPDQLSNPLAPLAAVAVRVMFEPCVTMVPK